MKKILSFILIANCLIIFGNNDIPGWKAEYGKTKSFVENKGQFDKRIVTNSPILFAYDGGDHNYFFTKEGVIFELSHKVKRDRTTEEKELRKIRKSEGFNSNADWQKFQDTDFHNRLDETKDELRALWVGANPNVEIVTEGKDNYYHSYSYYNSANQLINTTEIPSFQKIIYKNLYPHIDAVYEFHPEIGIKYSLVLHPGADPTVVQLKYSKDFELQSDGKIKTPTLLGDIIDHEPLTFYANNNRNIIQSNYRIQGNSIYFELANYDKSQTVILDPWTQTPNFNTNWKCVWECERDAAGNVYIIGGVMPLQLIKYDNAGNQQWVYNTPYDTTMWLGGFATSNAGDSYVCNGSSARIQRINTAGTMVWNNANPGGLFGGTEFWNITFNCDQTKLVIGGTELPFGITVNPEPWVFDVDMNSGNILSSVQVTGPPSGFGEGHEVRSIVACDNNKYYYMTHDTLGYIHSNLSACGSTGATNVKSGSNYNLGYKCEDYRYDNSGIQALKPYGDFIYVHKGDSLQKRNFNTGALVSSLLIPGGSFTYTTTVPFLGTIDVNQVGCSGIDIDECGNIYIGTTNSVLKYDQNLAQLASYPTSFNVYDVHVNTGGEIIACGSTGNSNSNSRTGYIQSISATACSATAIVCCDAAVCPADILCVTDAPVTLTPVTTPGGTWSGNGVNASGVFNPATAGVGEHVITYTLPCGSDQVIITVSACEPLVVCKNTDGSLTASNGVGTYTWQENIPAGSTPITNQAECTACGYTWNGFPFNACLDVVQPVTTCNSPGGYQTFGTGSTIMPGTNFPIRVRDAAGSEFIINSQAELDALAECTEPVCPTITVSIQNQTDVLCFGGNTGTATVSASGGTTPYTYSWTGGLTGNTQSSLTGQTYTVTATDAEGCTGNVQVTINQPTQLTATYSATDATCGESDGEVTISPNGGAGNYTYVWNPNVSTTATANNLAAGTYEVTISDGNNCQIVQTVLVNNQNAPVITLTSSTDETCTGSADGTATIDVTGGTGGYTYSWSPSGGSAATATGLTSGVYTVTVTDDDGCISTLQVTIGAITVITVDAIINNEDCGELNGTINLNVAGGSGNYTYQWSNGATTSSISGLQNGNYSVVVSDTSGCSINQTYNVGVNGSLNVDVDPPFTTIQVGDSVQINATGGVTYTWTPETGLSCTDCPNPIATPTNTTTYVVYAVDANGCGGQDSIIIFVDALCGEIFVPTIFSPNFDGTNDMHCVLGGCIRDFELIIYNRWGERVFVSRDPNNCWDGYFRGKQVQSGVYVYKLTTTLIDGTQIKDSGNINVVR